MNAISWKIIVLSIAATACGLPSMSGQTLYVPNGAVGTSANGNVGIGTSTPTQPLHVVGNVYSTAGVIATTLWSSDSVRKTNPASPLYFRNSAGTPEMTVDSNGNVGIGTSAPGATLHVNGSVIVDNRGADNLIVKGAQATPPNLAYLANNHVTKFYTRVDANYGLAIFDQWSAVGLQAGGGSALGTARST